MIAYIDSNAVSAGFSAASCLPPVPVTCTALVAVMLVALLQQVHMLMLVVACRYSTQIAAALTRAEKFVRGIQRPDGSW